MSANDPKRTFPSNGRPLKTIADATRSASGHQQKVYLSITLVIARVDKRHRSFDQFHDRYVARRTHLKRTDLWRAIDDFRRIDCRHRDHLLEREAEAHKLRHHPG
jgi:hypothetical protein